ncbi:hypothetical protein Pint_32815 [Pistacia integerrima]|uniref:Uncharacterized protein n=1 Tax=Pistacia integerrima TaxID=434235 RepID=A0ACC0X9W1_9ROSI|nr:hypothetical protein Pint_32815 [Pistacia integerrima]
MEHISNVENFTLGVEMKEMEDWALVLVEALMREVDSVSLLRSKHYCTVACFLWWLFYNSARGRATLELGSSNYELGRGDKVGGWRPKPIPSLEDMKANFFLGDMVDMVSWVIVQPKIESTVVIKALGDERVVYIACGGSSSAAIKGKKS